MKKILLTILAIISLSPVFSQLDGCSVDIRVELESPFNTFTDWGPTVFEVTGVTIGPGEELGLADEITNPSYLVGALSIDMGGSNIFITAAEVLPSFGASSSQIATIQITNLNCPNGFKITDLFINTNEVIQTDPPFIPESNENYDYDYDGYFLFSQSFTENSIILQWIVEDQSISYETYWDAFWIVQDSVTHITVNCREEIIGSVVVADADCDVSGIDITITAPDETSIMATTGQGGTFMLPDGPFMCGTYTASFTDLSQLPVCYTDGGNIEPIVFEVDGEEGIDDELDFMFVVGVIENELYNQLSLSPNPAINSINIDLPGKTIHDIHIYNESGSLVVEQSNLMNFRTNVDVSPLPQGLYLVYILGEDFKLTKKLIKW